MNGMNSTQQQAFDIYYESADMDNGFIPMSFNQVAEECNKLGLKRLKVRWGVGLLSLGGKIKLLKR